MTIEATSIGLRRGGSTILSNVDFRAEGGQVVAIVGPNGAGKSTLLGILSGEIRPSTGHVRLDDRDMASISAAELSVRRAVVPQATHLSFPFTVAEVVGLGATVPGFATESVAMDEGVANALARVDLEAFAHRTYTSLSGGERQRVHLARAFCQLASAPDVSFTRLLLLDEPTASLDLAHQLLVLQEARRSAEAGLLVVAVLHDLNLASTYADKIVVMANGQVVADGRREDVMSGELLSKVFGCEIDVGVTSPDKMYYVIPQYCRLNAAIRETGR